MEKSRKPKKKKIEFDKGTGTIIKKEEISFDSNEIKEIRKELRAELLQIVGQVKQLRKRADEIKEMLGVLGGV